MDYKLLLMEKLKEAGDCFNWAPKDKQIQVYMERLKGLPKEKVIESIRMIPEKFTKWPSLMEVLVLVSSATGSVDSSTERYVKQVKEYHEKHRRAKCGVCMDGGVVITTNLKTLRETAWQCSCSSGEVFYPLFPKLTLDNESEIVSKSVSQVKELNEKVSS